MKRFLFALLLLVLTSCQHYTVGSSDAGSQPDASHRTGAFRLDPSSPAPFGPPGALVTPPDVSTFTQFNPAAGCVTASSAATIANHGSGYGVVIYGTGTSAHECFNGVFLARGSNKTLIVEVDAPYWDSQSNGVNSSPPYGGIFIYDNATSKSVFFGPYAGVTSGDLSGIFVFHQNITGSSTATAATFIPGRSTFPLWLKWHDDGVNYVFSYSFDGNFTNSPSFSESRTVFLAGAGTHVGVAAGAIQPAGVRTSSPAFSMWIGSWSISTS